MIKFFRKIRHKLLSENKFSKYLIYAIGEIVLVVIGILIALKINNWNIKEQERKTERINLIALQEEFQQNADNLDNVIVQNTSIIQGADKLIKAFNVSVLDTISERGIAIYILQAVARDANFVHKSGVLTEILSSGELKLIQNNKLKHRLAGFGSWIERVEQQEAVVNDYRQEIMKQITKSGNLKKIFTEAGMDFNWESALDSVSNKSFFNSITQLNQLLSFKSASEYSTYVLYQPLREEIEEILKILSSELKK